MKRKSINLPLILSTIISLTLLGSFSINAAEQNNNFLVITDIHLDLKTKRPMTINPIIYNSRNDLDKATFTKMLTEISNGIKKHTIANPNFILLLGDLVGHKRKSPKNVYENESLIFTLLKNQFPSTPILYIFGNTDTLGGDYGNFTSSNKEHNSPYHVAKKSGWKGGFLSTGNICSVTHGNHFPCIITENRKLGYYSSYIYPNLRLIALNSILFSTKRTGDIAKQYSAIELEWLTKQLKEAQDNDESVLIAMHIPPGSNILDYMDFWRDAPNKIFLENVKTYQSNIIGILAGHTHSEELKIIREKMTKNIDGIQVISNKNINLVLFTAGLSTSHGNAPSIKTFHIMSKDDQWQLFDYTTFGFDQDNHENIFLKNIYNYRDQYCAKNQGQKNSMLECLANDNISDITSNILKYYTVKNPNFPGIIIAPKNVYINY